MYCEPNDFGCVSGLVPSQSPLYDHALIYDIYHERRPMPLSCKYNVRSTTISMISRYYLLLQLLSHAEIAIKQINPCPLPAQLVLTTLIMEMILLNVLGQWPEKGLVCLVSLASD